MIGQLLPPGAAVAIADVDDWRAELIGPEAEAVAAAVIGRQREFRAGRSCARRALAQLGFLPVAIPVGERRQPVWPAGVRGSITHCAGFCAAAVARQDLVSGLGIDAAENQAMAPRIAEQVINGSDGVVGDLADDIDPWTLVFSAKEALYKAWYPMTGQWLGFGDVGVRVGASTGLLDFTFLSGDEMAAGLPTFQGRWTYDSNHVFTAAWAD